jgi:acid phosphatase (class A)
MKRFTSLIAAAAIVITTGVIAKETFFVTPQQSDIRAFLPPPPADQSDEVGKELVELHHIAETRTPAELALAQADDQDRTIFIYRTVLGPRFAAETLPRTAALSARLHGDATANIAPAKAGFHRIHPYDLDPSLTAACKRGKKERDDSAYPSGHSTSGYVLAYALIEMVPEQRDAILARADLYAHNRLVCSKHWPSDVAAGKASAARIHELMRQNPAYRAELTAAATEIRQALGLPPLSR